MSQTEVETIPNPEQQAQNLKAILDQHKQERVVVVGTTCTGKSTLLRHTPEAVDMDEVIFPQLTPKESAYVCQSPWTEEIGREMKRLAKKYVQVEPGHPVFGTIVFDSDLVIELIISDELLRERVGLRSAQFEDAKNMQKQIEQEIKNSGIPVIQFPVG